MLPHQVGLFNEKHYPPNTKTYRALQDFFLVADVILEKGRSFYWMPDEQAAIFQHRTDVNLDVKFGLTSAQLQELVDVGLIKVNE